MAVLALIAPVSADDSFGSDSAGTAIASYFQAVPHNSAAGVMTSYDLYFALPVERLSQLKGGGISLDFPESYDLSSAAVSTVNHDGGRHRLSVTSVETGERSITIFLTIENASASTVSMAASAADTVRFSLVLDSVANATVAGSQQLDLLLFDNTDRVVLANIHSNSFFIKAGVFVSLAMNPIGDQAVRSGDIIPFGLTGLDEFGNVVTETDAGWMLTADSDPIGYFVGSAFVTTGTGLGRVQAQVDGSRIESGLIEVVAGPLTQIVMSISPDQVVDVPLLKAAQIILLDANNNPVIDHDLATNPITLVADRGILVSSVLSDPLLADSGVIDLLAAGVRYQGESGPVRIRAEAGAVISSELIVSFNGYDIVTLTTPLGQPITKLYSNLLTNVLVDVSNRGALKANSRPTLKAHFLSGGGSLERTFVQLSNGATTSLMLELATDNLTEGANELHIELRSEYLIESAPYTVIDSLIVPVTVMLPSPLALVPGSFFPDSVYAGVSFETKFAVVSSSAVSSIDSSFVQVRLYSDTLLPAVDTVLSGWLTDVNAVSDTFFYSGLQSMIRSDLAAGLYIVRLDHFFVSGTELHATAERYPGSIAVIPQASVSYSSGSLSPQTAQAGVETAFGFDLILAGTDTLLLNPGATTFTLQGSGFSITGSLTTSDNYLVPGSNRLTADSLFIPASQLNQNISARMELAYQVAGSANFMSFSSNFEGETILVEELPLVQITSVTSLAPNRPKVNTLQPFQIRCRVLNLSSDPVGSFRLALASDGSSQYDPYLTVPSLPGHDSTELLFDVVAASDSNSAEVFLVTVDSGDVVSKLPLDNSASVTVQIPASLKLTRVPAADSVFADRGSIVSLSLRLLNEGQSETSSGVLRLTNGTLFGLADPYFDTIAVGQPLAISLATPEFDTIVSITVDWWNQPIDLNDSSTVPVAPESFTLKIITTALDAELIVSSQVISSSLISPGKTIDLATIQLSNIGTFPDAQVRVDSIAIFFASPDNQMISPGRILDPVKTGIYEGSDLIAATQLRSDRVVFTPDDFRLPFDSGRQLTLRMSPLAVIDEPFKLILETGSIYATFAGGPQSGQTAGVSTLDGRSEVIAHIFTPAERTSLNSSFTIRDNPFNPELAPAEMQFYMPRAGIIELKILTITGELVHTHNYPPDELVIGDLNIIEWDGRNDIGQMVLDGVYVAMLTIINSEERAMLKIAVVK